MIDLCEQLTQETRFRLLMKLKTMSPQNKFGSVFDKWALDTHGLHIYSAGIIEHIGISDEDYTALLLKVIV
jgi:hypothetical protein